MDISPSSATQLVDRLVQHGLVDRVAAHTAPLAAAESLGLDESPDTVQSNAELQPVGAAAGSTDDTGGRP